MATLHERLRFDTGRGQVLDADRRYLLLRADVLMGVFDALPDAARGEALHAFGRSTASRGAGSVRAYAAEVGADALCASMQASAASLGWGCWQLDAAPAGDTRSLILAVDNSPFAAATTRRDAPACHAIAGMLEALAEALWNAPASAVETRCAAQAGGERCLFEARPSTGAAMPPAGAARPPQPP